MSGFFSVFKFNKNNVLVLFGIFFSVFAGLISSVFLCSLLFSFVVVFVAFCKDPAKVAFLCGVFFLILLAYFLINELYGHGNDVYFLRAVQIIIPFSLFLGRSFDVIGGQDCRGWFYLLFLLQSMSAALFDNYLTAENTNSAFAYLPVFLLGVGLQRNSLLLSALSIFIAIPLASIGVTLVSVSMLLVSAFLFYKSIRCSSVNVQIVSFLLLLVSLLTSFIVSNVFGFLDYTVLFPYKLVASMESLSHYLSLMEQGELKPEGSVSRRLLSFYYLLLLIWDSNGLPLGLGYTTSISHEVLGIGSFHNSILVSIVEFGFIPISIFVMYVFFNFNIRSQHFLYLAVILLSSLSMSDNFFSNMVFWLAVVCFSPSLKLVRGYRGNNID
ncbi:MAG: hypothetical protein K6L74_12640 [Neptuniibacter sp.]